MPAKPHLRPAFSASRYVLLSIAAALATIVLKGLAWLLTGSVGLLSDALESFVNLAAATLTLILLRYAARPPDEEHTYGHGKAEYFASGAEGALIIFAAISIIASALPRLINPREIEQVSFGVLLSASASIINLVVARILLRAGTAHGSIALEADAHHLMTDVWTSGAVIVGILAATLTGWVILDPIIALLMGANIIWTGVQLLRRSALGLLDSAVSREDFNHVQSVLTQYRAEGIQFHALRTRQAGDRSFVSMHVLVPPDWTVLRGHQLLERIERDIRHAMRQVTVFTHLEPQGDPSALDDVGLARDE
ncbi:MAG: cation transporter [Thermoflexales bacterium]|nr:cation transporter [Thermoflexales bacterium]MBP8241659.1 cation transporter [Thermoflexales bacterium]